jgi:hypothetical protein
VASVLGQDETIGHIATATEGQFELSRRLESSIDELNGLTNQEFRALRSLISDALSNAAPVVKQKVRNEVTADLATDHAHQTYTRDSSRRRWIEVSHTIRFLVDVDEIGVDAASQ